LKQWMNERLKSGITPECIIYFTGELIDDHHSLVRLLTEFLNERQGSELCYILLDEVTYIKDWDKGIKYLADTIDFHLYPLSFSESVRLNKKITSDEIERLMPSDVEPGTSAAYPPYHCQNQRLPIADTQRVWNSHAGDVLVNQCDAFAFDCGAI